MWVKYASMASSVDGLPYAMSRMPVFGSRDTRRLPFVDDLDEQLEVLERRLRVNAVTEVEDVAGPAARPAQDLARAGADQLWRPEQHSWIEVALDPALVTDALPALVEGNRPVERHDVGVGGSNRFEQPRGPGAEMDARDAERRERLEQRAC